MYSDAFLAQQNFLPRQWAGVLTPNPSVRHCW